MSASNRAAFIDRDGVINEERNYVYRIEDFVLLPGVIEGLILLRDAGYRLIVVTNQAGIAHGHFDQAAMDRLHNHLRKMIAKYNVVFDAIYFCPHHPRGIIKALAIECECRKPSPGMLFQAAKDFDLDLSSSVLIGDKLSDIQAGKRARVGRTIIVESGHDVGQAERHEADMFAANLLASARALTIA